MAYPPTQDTEASLSLHLSGTCLGSPLSSVWVSGPVCAPIPALGLFQDLSFCFNPWFEFLSLGFRIPILAQGVLRHFWQLCSRAGWVTAQPSAGSWGSSSAEESRPPCQGRHPDQRGNRTGGWAGRSTPLMPAREASGVGGSKGGESLPSLSL